MSNDEQSTLGRPGKHHIDNDENSTAHRISDHQIHEAVGRRVEECPYGFVFNRVSWRYTEGRLTLHGIVSSFYLKQVLQELMRGIDQVEQIANHVDVVNSTGMSSEPPSKPR
jgi:hypothetical protein